MSSLKSACNACARDVHLFLLHSMHLHVDTLPHYLIILSYPPTPETTQVPRPIEGAGAARTGVGESTLESKIKVIYDSARNPRGDD